MVLFFLEMVLGNEKPADAGELRSSVHGDHRAGEEADGRPPPGSLRRPEDRRIDHGRP